MNRGALLALLGWLCGGPAPAAETPGVTATEIRIGGVFPFSGPASSIGTVGKGVLAYVQMINDHGGINGRNVRVHRARRRLQSAQGGRAGAQACRER